MRKLKISLKFFLKKRLWLAIFLCLAFSMSASSQTSEISIPLLNEINEIEHQRLVGPGEIMFLKIKQISKAALLQNFDIQMTQIDWKRAKLDEMKSRGRYDLNLASAYTFNKETAEQPSAFAGVKNTVKEFKASLSKTLPTGTTVGVDYQMQYNKTDSPFTSVNPNFDTKTTITLRQTLLQNFLGVIDRTEVNIARLQGKLQGAETMERIEDEVLAVRTAYWDLAVAIEDYETALEFLNVSKDLLKIGQRKFTMGTLEKADYLNLMSQTRVRVEQVLRAENNLRLASNELAFLLGIDFNLVYFTEDTLVPTEKEPNLEDCLDTAFKQRDAFKWAELNVKRFGLEVTRTGFKRLPTLEAVGSYSANGLDQKPKKAFDESFSKTWPTWYLGFEFKYPLENREARAGFRQAKLDRERSEIELKKIIARINREVNDAYLVLESSQKQLIQTIKIVALEKEKYDEEVKMFQIGRGDSQRLTQFQNDWIEARFFNVRTKRDVLVAEDSLRKARGTLLKDIGLADQNNG